MCHSDSTTDVFGEDMARQPVVRHLNDFFLCFKLNNGGDWPEDFFMGNLHVEVAVVRRVVFNYYPIRCVWYVVTWDNVPVDRANIENG